MIAGTSRCHLPTHLHTWGWAVQLYALRSRRSWGIGDLGDLARLGRWSAAQGAGVLLLNPLHAALPLTPQDPSPYFPSSRLFRNPLYLRVEDVPGARGDGAIAELRHQARRLNSDPRIDRDAVFALKMRALEWACERSEGAPAFDRYRAEQGEQLELFATFNTLAERFQSGWRGWPQAYRAPGGTAVRRFASKQRARVRFHCWLQWQLDVQLKRAARAIPLMTDLAVGFDPGGADAWAWQDLLADGVSIGAPPDAFAPAGQDWGVPPFDPARLRAAGYEPLARTFSSAMRHAAAVRVDHVMGLFRMWWTPPGTYVYHDSGEALDVLARESRKAGAYVVGEDLGTVESGVRAVLARRNILGYKLLWFEERAPSRYPRLAVAAATTHDLPTIAGVWTGEDALELRPRLERLTGLRPGASPERIIRATYRALAASPSRVVLAGLEDAVASRQRPNHPAGDPRNWSLALPRTLEQIERDALPHKLASELRKGRRVSSRR